MTDNDFASLAEGNTVRFTALEGPLAPHLNKTGEVVSIMKDDGIARVRIHGGSLTVIAIASDITPLPFPIRSYKVGIVDGKEAEWCFNDVRYPTETMAKAAMFELTMSWMTLTRWSVFADERETNVVT